MPEMASAIALLLLVLALCPATVVIATCAAGQYVIPVGTPTAASSITYSYSSAWSGQTDPSISGTGWLPSTQQPSVPDVEWVQMDLGSAQLVGGITQDGVPQGDNPDACVSAFTVKYSVDGTNWISAGLLQGALGASYDYVNNVLFWARYLRLYVTALCTPGSLTGMRANALVYPSTNCMACPAGTYASANNVCQACPSSTYSNSGASACTAIQPSLATTATALLSGGSVLTYLASSWFFEADCQVPWLGGTAAWCAETTNLGSEYLIMDLGYVGVVTGVVTQGRSNNNQWVGSMNIYYSNCSTGSWTSAGAFSANTDMATQVTNAITATARFVKLVPTASTGWIAMRAGLKVQLPALGQCPPGSYGVTSCTSCPVGTYSGASGASACTSCIAGTYAGSTGATACASCSGSLVSPAGASACAALCPAGFRLFVSGSSACAPCGAGTFTGAPTLSVTCTDCGTGKYASGLGTVSCPQCAIGTFQGTAGMSTCQACSAGTYASVVGDAQCQTCPSGSYTASTGASVCTQCPMAYYQGNVAATACTLCNGGYYINYVGATRYDLYPCTGTSLYAPIGSTACSTCPIGQHASSSNTFCCNNGVQC